MKIIKKILKSEEKDKEANKIKQEIIQISNTTTIKMDQMNHVLKRNYSSQVKLLFTSDNS